MVDDLSLLSTVSKILYPVPLVILKLKKSTAGSKRYEMVPSMVRLKTKYGQCPLVERDDEIDRHSATRPGMWQVMQMQIKMQMQMKTTMTTTIYNDTMMTDEGRYTDLWWILLGSNNQGGSTKKQQHTPTNTSTPTLSVLQVALWNMGTIATPPNFENYHWLHHHDIISNVPLFDVWHLKRRVSSTRGQPQQ